MGFFGAGFGTGGGGSSGGSASYSPADFQAGAVVPTTRSDASALQENDVWYDSSLGEHFYYKSANWCSAPIYAGASRTISNTTNLMQEDSGGSDDLYLPYYLEVTDDPAIYYESYSYAVNGVVGDGSNYWNLEAAANTRSGTILAWTYDQIAGYPSPNFDAGILYTGTVSVAEVLTNDTISTSKLIWIAPAVQAVKVGTPGVLGVNVAVKFRRVHP